MHRRKPRERETQQIVCRTKQSERESIILDEPNLGLWISTYPNESLATTERGRKEWVNPIIQRLDIIIGENISATTVRSAKTNAGGLGVD